MAAARALARGGGGRSIRACRRRTRRPGVAGAAVFAGAAAGAGAAVAALAGLAFAAFLNTAVTAAGTLPVDVVVVPSLQVVGAGSAATLGIANANTSNGSAIRPATVMFFMNTSLPGLVRSAAGL